MRTNYVSVSAKSGVLALVAPRQLRRPARTGRRAAVAASADPFLLVHREVLRAELWESVAWAGLLVGSAALLVVSLWP